MSTKPLMLDGLVKPPRREDDAADWRREKETLERDNRILRSQLEDAKAENKKLTRSLSVLREQLSPLHHALRAVFGEIELAIGEETYSPQNVASASGQPQHSSIDPRWQSWKENLPGKPAQMIDLLLLHKDMSTKQLMTAMKCGKDAVYQAAYKLSKAGLISQVGGRYSLNPL